MPDSLQQYFDTFSTTKTGGLPAGVRVWVQVPGQEPLKNIGGDIPHDPASLTKLMNLYLDLRAGDTMPETIRITAGAMRYHLNKHDVLNLGDTLTREDALKAMMVASDNVAATAIAIANGHGRTDQEKHHDFVERMNATAINLGMQNTHFANASGWGPHDKKRDPVGQPAQTTASDMARLIIAIYRDYPQAAKLYLENQSVTYKKGTHAAHHGLNDPEAPSYAKEEGLTLGAKTGFTRKAMYNIATMVTAEDGDQLVVVLLGMPPLPRSKALTIVEKEDLPKPLTKSKQDTGTVRGDNERDAVVKHIIGLWHKLVHSLHHEQKTVACPPETPNAPQVATMLSRAASDAVSFSQVSLPPLSNGILINNADVATAPAPGPLPLPSVATPCKSR